MSSLWLHSALLAARAEPEEPGPPDGQASRGAAEVAEYCPQPACDSALGRDIKSGTSGDTAPGLRQRERKGLTPQLQEALCCASESAPACRPLEIPDIADQLPSDRVRGTLAQLATDSRAPSDSPLPARALLDARRLWL